MLVRVRVRNRDLDRVSVGIWSENNLLLCPIALMAGYIM